MSQQPSDPHSGNLRPGIPTGIDAGSQLNFHQLYTFHAVASHGSFSRAAEALGITQPAVSIQIQELEKSMGVTFLHRRSRGVRVTETGQTVLAWFWNWGATKR